MPGQVTGTIGQEDVKFDNAATESTLQLLVQSMEKVAKGLGVKGKDYAKELKNLNKESKLRQENNKLLEEENENLEDLNQQLDESKKKLKAFGEDVSAVVKTIFSNTTVGLDNLAGVLSNMGPLGQIAGALTSVVSENINIFRKLSQSGIDLGDSIFAAQTAAARAGLPLDIFSQVVSENAGNLALFAGSSAEGARRFAEISNQLKKSGFGQSLMRLGFSMEETAEYTAGYIEQLTRLGRSQSMTDADLAEGTRNYLLELDKLSRVTGMSRKEAEAAMKTAANDKRLRALMANIGEKERVALQGVVATLQKASPEMAEGISELVATNGIPISDFGKALARNNPELVENAKRLRAGQITQEEFNDSVRAAAERSSALSEEEEKLHAYLVARGKESPFADRVALQAMKNYAKEQDKVTDAQRRAMAMQSKSVAGFDESMTQIANFFKMVFMPVASAVANGLGIVTQVISGIIDVFGAVDSDLKDVFGEETMGAIKDSVANLASILTVAGLAVLAFTKTMAVKKAASGLAGKVLGTTVDTAPGGGMGKALGGLGTGAGTALTGIATGLKAFANPLILKGAAILSASIAIIGAGIAGAAWLIGKALPSLAEGFSAFDELNGENLLDVGKGIAALGAGLLVFGAGSALSTVGSTFSSIVEGVAGFFGAKSPFEKLIEMSQHAPELKMLGEAMQTIDFSRLDASKVNLENIEIGANRARDLASALELVNAQLNQISQTSLTDAIASTMEKATTSIIAAISPESVKKEQNKQESLLSDLNSKMDMLNNNISTLVGYQEEAVEGINKTAKFTKSARGAFYG